MQELRSHLDESVNFVVPTSDGGFFESRYVRRCLDYFICYLSSHSGCNRGCRMCHLTATKQTMMTDANPDDILAQAYPVLGHYASQQEARYVHFNWMARGEPLCNQFIIDDSYKIFRRLVDDMVDRALIPRFNISTIMPQTLTVPLDKVFPVITPTIYYSLYSVNEEFRNKWLPGAMPVKEALQRLKEYQESTKKIIKVHFAFIKGENDGVKDLKKTMDTVHRSGLKVQYNIVRYNPFSPEYGQESEEMSLLEFVMRREGGCNAVQVVPRVGQDVYASCGMFYNAKD